MPDNLHILGIRHHGPGSAQSVLRALDELKPDCVLIEGPPDADEMIPFAAREEMHPPVAILVHDVAEPSDAVYYPFAAFSPEWQAIRWGAGEQRRRAVYGFAAVASVGDRRQSAEARSSTSSKRSPRRRRRTRRRGRFRVTTM